jgi:hypothetical protein
MIGNEEARQIAVHRVSGAVVKGKFSGALDPSEILEQIEVRTQGNRAQREDRMRAKDFELAFEIRAEPAW